MTNKGIRRIILIMSGIKNRPIGGLQLVILLFTFAPAYGTPVKAV